MSFQANDYKAITDKFAEYRKLNPEIPYTNELSKETISKKQEELNELIKKENKRFSQQNDLLCKHQRNFKQVSN